MHSRVEKGEEAVGAEQRQSLPLQSPSQPLLVSFPLQILLLCCLGLVALIPRIILANQLDLITDEIIYILTGKSYLPLVTHITTSPWVCPGGGTDCWQVNYEHPPLVKFFIGLSILGNNHSGQLLNELIAARIPSIIAGTTLIMAIYWLGRKPFGHIVALLAALSLAFSPWLVYFSSIAYLDITMTTFITIAYLLTWHATHRPWLYLCVALFVALGIDSKYTAALIIPGILLFTAYYFFVLRPHLPVRHRLPAIPWLWWLAASILTPLCFLALDPAIWSDPPHMLMHSALYEWQHSVGGHLTYLAGSYSLHVPHWAALYIIINKISACATVPAAMFGMASLIYLVRFHLAIGRGMKHEGREEGRKTSPHDALSFRVKEATTMAFLLIWLLATLVMFSLLNIVVGTHYLLPLAPPIVIAGAYTLVYLARYGIRKMGRADGGLQKAGADGSSINVEPGLAPNTVNLSTGIDGHHKDAEEAEEGKLRPYESSTPQHLDTTRGTSAYRGVNDGLAPSRPLRSLSLQFALFLIIVVVLVGPHLLGLLNVAGAEGYTSEFFHGEDMTLQVAYPGYREAAQWLERHTQGDQRIGLVALPQTLQRGDTNASWFVYNNNLPKRLQMQEAHPKDSSYPYDYLVWPMHLVQRGYVLPPSWHIIHKITGGDTTYCYITVAHKTYANP